MFGGISVWQLLILLVVVILIFGTKKLRTLVRTLGGDLGGAVKGFKKAMNDGEKAQADEPGKIEDKQQKDAQFSESVKDEEKTKS